MITEDQSEALGFLGNSSTHDGARVERLDTHASVVFLAGDRAWKLKRAVRYDYLDFSTVERRRAMCEAEVRVNRRTAPDLYLGVKAIVRRTDRSLAIGGPGEAVDTVVEMRRFDQEGLFDRLAARGALDLGLMPPLARTIAAFHLAAARRADHGGAQGMRWVIEGNAGGFAQEGRGIFEPAAAAALTNESRALADRQAPLLERRREAGFVRECHGDLHLRNLVLLDGRPTLFDGVEFNDEIACIDVLYDLAFLLMDLWRRRLPRHANAVLNAYLTATGDLEGVRLLPLFLSCRAAVRAKTSATAAGMQQGLQRRPELEATARDYLTLARTLLHPPQPCLIAIGGFSGSGKSTLARALAPSIGPVPGALVVRSDDIRKRLAGVDPLTRLDFRGYTPEVTGRVYRRLADDAGRIVRSGQAAIVDAVFARRADREAIERQALTARVPFVGLWLDAQEPVLVARTRERLADASDADAAVVRAQLAQGTGELTWARVAASPGPDAVLQAAADVVERHLQRVCAT